MLHGVSKELFVVQSNVRSNEIREFNSLNLQVFFSSQFNNVVHDFSMRTSGYADFDEVIVALFLKIRALHGLNRSGNALEGGIASARAYVRKVREEVILVDIVLTYLSREAHLPW